MNLPVKDISRGAYQVHPSDGSSSDRNAMSRTDLGVFVLFSSKSIRELVHSTNLGRTTDVESMLTAAVMNTFYIAPQTGSKYEIQFILPKQVWGKHKKWSFIIRISLILISFHSEMQQ